MKKKYADGGMMRPAVMPGRSGTAGRPASTGLARAAAMSGRTMPTTGRPAMKKGGSVKKYADGGSTGPQRVVPVGSTSLPPNVVSRARSAFGAARSQNDARRAGMTRANHRAGVRAPDPVPDAEGNYTRPAMKKGGKVAEKGESKAMVKKEIEFFKKKGAPKSMIKHEKAEAKKYARGGGIESKGKTRGKFV